MTTRRLAAAVAAVSVLAALLVVVTDNRRGPEETVQVVIPAAEPAPSPTPAPSPSPTTPVPTTTPGPPVRVTFTEPPALVTIPVDLIATPTPNGPDYNSLPFLASIPTLPRAGDVVYLTFDDGPDPIYTNQVLDVLARHGASATFFVIGELVDSYPGTAARIVADGHAVGNHTYFHEALPLESAEYIARTLSATNAALERATGTTSRCVRPPYGALDQPTYDLLSGQGYQVHLWDVDSEDWQTTNPTTIVQNVLTSLSLGDRVLLHDGPSNRAATVAALEILLGVLSERGVQFATLSC